MAVVAISERATKFTKIEELSISCIQPTKQIWLVVTKLRSPQLLSNLAPLVNNNMGEKIMVAPIAHGVQSFGLDDTEKKWLKRYKKYRPEPKT